MNIRPTQASNFELVKSGLNLNLSKLIRAQEQASTGKRLLRPSDDPIAAATVLALQRQLGDVSRFSKGIDSARPLLEQGMSALNEASSIMTEARGIAIQGLNGTLSPVDRHALAQSLRLLKARMVDLGNTQLGDRYVFGGTSTKDAPFREVDVDGRPRVVYGGDNAARSVSVGPGVELPVNVPGDEAFGRNESSGVNYVGNSGLTNGTSADAGSGYGYLTVRHDATTGPLLSGLAFVNGGTDDTLIGERKLTIDSAAGTVQFGNGAVVQIPASGSANVANLALTDEHGAVLHVDFTNYDGTSSTSMVDGAGSVSFDGTNFTTLDLANHNQQITDGNGTVLHVDSTRAVLATQDLYSFQGGVNAFDSIQGMIDDLENGAGLDDAHLQDRLRSRLGDFDRNFDNLQIGLGTLGSRAQRMDSSKSQLDDHALDLQGLVSNQQDADLSSVILDMNMAQQTLQVAQATGAKLLQNSLLNYLG